MEIVKNLIKRDRHGFAVVFPNYSAMSTDEIRQIFSKFGIVRSINVTGDERGYRFVRMETYEDAKNAIEGLHKKSNIKFCTHSRKKANNTKLDGNNNSSNTKNLNLTRTDEYNTSVVISDGSDDWDSASLYSARGKRNRSGSSVSVRYNKSSKVSDSLDSQSGNCRETSATRRNAEEKSSGMRSVYSWDKDRATAGRSAGELDTDWRSTRDKPSSGNVDANDVWNSCRGTNITSFAKSRASIWDDAKSSSSQSTRTVTNYDSYIDCDFQKSLDSQSTTHPGTAKNEDCDSDIWPNNLITENSKTGRNEDCDSFWDLATSSNNRNSVDGKTQNNKNKRSNSHIEMYLKTSRNINDESISNSIWDNFWNSNNYDQNEKSNHDKSTSKESVKSFNSENDISNETTKRIVPKQKINLQSRLDNIRNMNNHRNAKALENNADDDVEDERIPDLVQKKTQADLIRQEIVVRNASEVIVGNIPENATPAYILYLFEEFSPVAISNIYSAFTTGLRYCHVYFKKDKNALDIEQKYDGYKLSGKRLIVSRPNRLSVLAAKD